MIGNITLRDSVDGSTSKMIIELYIPLLWKPVGGYLSKSSKKEEFIENAK
jgi:hypothetical protein